MMACEDDPTRASIAATRGGTSDGSYIYSMSVGGATRQKRTTSAATTVRELPDVSPCHMGGRSPKGSKASVQSSASI